MKITLSAKPFAADLKAVLPAVATRPGLPILSGVRLEALEEGLVIEATDLELAVRRVVRDGLAVDATGSVVVPAKALAKAVAAMAEPEVALESAPNDGRANLDVRAGTRTVTLRGWATEDWPAIPPLAEIAPIASVGASAAADAFERAALCASDDEARPVLTGVALFFEEDPPSLEVVATDSYRLGVVRIPLASPPRVPENPPLVPARACRLLDGNRRAARGRERWRRSARRRRIQRTNQGEPSQLLPDPSNQGAGLPHFPHQGWLGRVRARDCRAANQQFRWLRPSYARSAGARNASRAFLSGRGRRVSHATSEQA